MTPPFQPVSPESPSSQNERSQFSGLSLVVGPAAGALVGVGCYDFLGMSLAASWTAMVAVWCAVWWISEVIPMAATAMIPFAVLPFFGGISHKEVALAFGHWLILLFLGGMILSRALERTQSHRQLALVMIRLTGGSSGKRVVLGFMLAAAGLSMWVSNTATALMMMPIALAVVGSNQSAAALKIPLLLGIAYACNVGGIATPIGTGPNAVFIGLYNDSTGSEFSFLEWMSYGLPVTLVMVPLTWWWLTRSLETGLLKVENPGSWTSSQKRVMVVFVLAALAWMTRRGWTELFGLDGVGDSTVAMILAVSLFLIPSGEKEGELQGKNLMDWDAAKSLSWDILLLIAGGIALAKGFIASGLSQEIGQVLSVVGVLYPWVLILLIGLLVSFLTEVTSNTATTNVILPILAAVTVEVGIDPFMLMIPATMAASCAFMLPVATPPNAIVMGGGGIKTRDMVRYGFIVNIIGVIVITLVMMVHPLVMQWLASFTGVGN